MARKATKRTKKAVRTIPSSLRNTSFREELQHNRPNEEDFDSMSEEQRIASLQDFNSDSAEVERYLYRPLTRALVREHERAIMQCMSPEEGGEEISDDRRVQCIQENVLAIKNILRNDDSFTRAKEMQDQIESYFPNDWDNFRFVTSEFLCHNSAFINPNELGSAEEIGGVVEGNILRKHAICRPVSMLIHDMGLTHPRSRDLLRLYAAQYIQERNLQAAILATQDQLFRGNTYVGPRDTYIRRDMYEKAREVSQIPEGRIQEAMIQNPNTPNASCFPLSRNVQEMNWDDLAWEESKSLIIPRFFSDPPERDLGGHPIVQDIGGITDIECVDWPDPIDLRRDQFIDPQLQMARRILPVPKVFPARRGGEAEL